MSDPGLAGTFIAALQDFANWLQAEQVPHTAIGGLAVSLVAQPRATQDVDVVIWLTQERWATFLQSGEDYGFVPRITDALKFAAKSRVLLLRHQESGISFDVSCGALEFEREMIERATTLEIGKLGLKVPTPEDLIITKAVAQRPKDMADIESILSVHRDLDLSRIRHWAREFATALEMPELFENLEKLIQRYRQEHDKHGEG